MGREFSITRVQKIHNNLIKQLTREIEEAGSNVKSLNSKLTLLHKAIQGAELLKGIKAGSAPLTAQQQERLVQGARRKALELQGDTLD